MSIHNINKDLVGDYSKKQTTMLEQRRMAILGTLDSKGDYFLDNPPMQPKYDIATYVESLGILVPQRFGGLDQAIASGKKFIMRSENPIEYYGAAGLFDSVIVDPQKGATLFGIKIDVNQSQIALENELKEYAKKNSNYPIFVGINSENYNDILSFSYREFLGGLNRSIVADTAIKNRYHIFSSDRSTGSYYHSYCIYDNGQILLDNNLPTELAQGLDDVITFYEDIRNLPKFNSQHCPIIEFQTTENKNYFLQYHRTRDEDIVDFELDQTLYPSMIPALFVRGKTSRQGDIIRVSAYYPGILNEDKFHVPDADAVINLAHSGSISEVFSRKLNVNLSYCENDIGYLVVKTYDNHLSKSKIFNPKLFIMLSDLYSEDKLDEFLDTSKDSIMKGEPITPMLMKVISDGRKCLVEYIS